MSDYIQEVNINEYPIAVSLQDTENKILFQMKNCVCKIMKDNGNKGTGFFLKINHNNDDLYLLITNNHVLGKDDINNNKNITITINDNKVYRNLYIGERKKFTDPELDITFIEIYPKKDDIKHFLDIDDDIDKEEDFLKKLYIKKSIYALHYPDIEGSMIKVSYGISKCIEEKEIYHYLNTNYGSSGSPILSLETFKVIGIHKGYSKEIKPNETKYNIGVLIKYAIEAFKKNNEKKNKRFKCIMSNTCEYIPNSDIHNLVKSNEVINITDDGEFKKHIIKEGKGIYPNKGDEIEMIYYHPKYPFPFFNEKIILESNDTKLWYQDIAIKSMKVGEKSIFFVSPKYLQSKSMRVKRFEMELLSEENKKKQFDINYEEKFLECKKLKEKGVEQFKNGNIKNSCCIFQQALKDFNDIKFNKEENKDEYINFHISILSNLCNCYNSLKDYNNVINIANKGLKIKEYAKFYYFRGISYAKNNELENAKKDLASLKIILGEKKIDEGVQFLEKIIREKEK